MAWDWLKDNNDEPNEFKPIDARGLLDGKEYHDYWITKLHNGLANVPKSLLGAVESIPAMAARTRPSVMRELENDLDGTGLMDSDADKAALSEVENQIKGTTAPIWEGARLGVKAVKDALPDANWESNVDESQLSYPKKIGGMIVENAPLMAAQLGASIINPVLGVGLMAGSIAGDAYNDLTEKGVDPLTAGQAGWLDAAAQAPLEGVGEMGWLKAFRELGTEGAAKLMGKAFVKEGLTEAVQEFPDETIPYIAEHGSLDGFDWNQLASNAVDAGVVGGIYGGGFAGLGRAINGKAQPAEQGNVSGGDTGAAVALVNANGDGDNAGGIGTSGAGNSDINNSNVTRDANGAVTIDAVNTASPAMHAMNRIVNELGINPTAASGIVGGLMHESGGDTTDISTTAKNPTSGAYGIAQWLGSRYDDLVAFAKENNADPNDLDTQISFIIHELKGKESGALQEILKAQTPDEAGRLADQFYERSEGTDEIRNQKASNAQKIYDMFMNGGADQNTAQNGGKNGSVPNPKSAEDFLKDLEETLPADTDEDVEKLNAIHKAIQGKNKKAQEELAAQYGWGKNAPETAQDAPEGTAQENTQASSPNASEPINSPSRTETISKNPKQANTAAPIIDATPQAGNGEVNKPSTVRTGSPRNGGANLPAVPRSQTPASVKPTVAPSTQGVSLPQAPSPLQLPAANTAGKSDNHAQVPQAKIEKARSNQRLKELVKQAFVDGDKNALARLNAMQINPDILEAVKNDVLSAHHSPLALPTVSPRGATPGTAAPIALPPAKASGAATVATNAPAPTNTAGESTHGAESDVKSDISKKENNHENTKKNQPVHRPEENKNDNAKPEQSKPSEGKDGKTPEIKNPVKETPTKESLSSGKTEEPQKGEQKKNDDKAVEAKNPVEKKPKESESAKSVFDLAPEYKKKADDLKRQFDEGEITAGELSDKLQKLMDDFNDHLNDELSDAEVALVRDANRHIEYLERNAAYEANPDRVTYEKSVEMVSDMNPSTIEGTLEEEWENLTSALREEGAAPAEGVWKNPFKGNKLQKSIYNREAARFKKEEAKKARYEKGKETAKELYENAKKEIQNVIDGYRKGKGNKDMAGKAITAWRNKLTKELSENADTKGLKFNDLEKDLSDFIKKKREELKNAKRGEKVEPTSPKSESKEPNGNEDGGKHGKPVDVVKPTDNNTADGSDTGKTSESQNENGSEQQPVLAEGYTTESGRLLSESDARDFIVKPDGSKEFGHFGEEIEDATGGKVLAKGIRLQVGFSRVANGKETGFGIIHIKKRESQLKKLGYNNAEEYILDIINNFSIIYDLGGGRIKLASVGSKFNVMPLDLELKGDGNGYYTVVTAIPKNTKRMQKEAGKKIFDRSASPSSTTGNGAVQDGGNRKNAGSIPQSATEKSNLPTSTNNIDETSKNVNNKPDLDMTTDKSAEASKILADGKKEIDDAFDRFVKGNTNGSGNRIRSRKEIQAIVNKIAEDYTNKLGADEIERTLARMGNKEIEEFVNYAKSKINEILNYKAKAKEEKPIGVDSVPWMPSQSNPVVKGWEDALYVIIKAVEKGNMSLQNIFTQFSLFETEAAKITDKELKSTIADMVINYKYKAFQTFFANRPEFTRAHGAKEVELSPAEIAERAKEKETKRTIEEDKKALELLGKDLYEAAYKPIVDYLRIIGRKSRSNAFESAVLYAKLIDSFQKNYGIRIETPALIIRQGKQSVTDKDGIKHTVAGSYNLGANAFFLSTSTDGLTFMHEATHMYVAMLKRFSSLTDDEVELYFGKDADRAKKAIESIREDLKRIEEWAKYSKEHLAEYDATDIQLEFGLHALAVEGGTDFGENVWREERIARGMEQYLGEGVAPSKELKSIFAKFKQWFIEAYRSLAGISRKPLPEDVRKFYDSMITGNRDYFANMAKRSKSGKSATVRTDDGKEFNVTYKIVPAETLTASNTADFGKNENYPEKLQPRDRDRVSMKEQVDDMARNLRPEDLAASRSVNQGAPLVNQDNVVENGNGRTMAITRAYTTDGDAYKASSQKYKQYLMEHAEEYGYTREEVEAMENPVLIRQRDSSSDSLQDSIIHSTEGGMKMSASQQAKVDAEKISPKTLSLYDYDGSGDLTKQSNNDFVVSALNEIADKSERDVVFNKDGTPSKAGIERVKSALAAYAYGDNSLLERISESTDTEDQNIVKAFSAAAPQVAAIKAKLDKGDVSKDYDLPKLLSDVLDFYFKCKNDGKSIKFALNETSLFDDDSSVSSVSRKNLARFIADNTRRPKAISDALVRMTKYIDGANEPGAALFSGEKMGLDEIVRTAVGLNASKFIPVSKPNARKYKHTIQPKENTWDTMPATQRKACIKLMDANGGHYDAKTKSFGFTDEKARDAALNVLEAYLSADSKASAKIAIVPEMNAEVVPNNRLKSMRLARRQPVRISIHGKTDTALTGRGWNGSPADFDHFDLAFIGTGEGNAAHGWGIYFARDVSYNGDADWGKKVSEGYKKRYGGANGKLYYAAIPSDNYLLDEQAPLSEQPKHVQESVRRALSYMEDLPEDSITEKSMHAIVREELYGNRTSRASVYKLMHGFLATRPKSSKQWNPSRADLESAREALDGYSVHSRAAKIESGGTSPIDMLDNGEWYDFERYLEKPDKEPSRESYAIATRDVLFDMFEAAEDRIKAFSAIPHPEKAKAYNKLLAIQAGADAKSVVDHTLNTLDPDVESDRSNLERALYRYISNPNTQNISAVEEIISSILTKAASKHRELTNGDIAELNSITNDLLSEFEYGANKLSAIAQDGILALTGHDVQQLLREAVAGSGDRQKAVAEILKDAGLKGYKYEGGMDGPCAVVFDNDAMKVINKFSVKTPYQKMVENITPIASDDLTAREKAIVDFAKKMGLQVQFFEGDPNLHGFHADGTNVVFLNRHSAMDLNQTFWHETFHWMRESNPELYNQMVKEVFGDKVSEEQLADYAASIGRTDMSKELTIEEMLADAMWDASKRGSFFEKLGIEHPSLCAKIIKWIKNLYEDFKAHFHNPQAGLTNTQIKRMSNTLSRIAEKLVDGDGNKLFSVDEKGNIKETAAGKRAVSGRAKVEAEWDGSNQKYRVTNKSLRADDTVNITKTIGNPNVNEHVPEIKKRLRKWIKGETFTTTADGIDLKANSSNNVGHFAASDHYNEQPPARRALLAKKSTIKSLIENAVYVEEQRNKYDPNLPTHFVQLYTAAKFRGKYYRVKITAKKIADGTYTVTDADLYNIDLRGEIVDKSAIKKALLSSPTHNQVRDKLQVTKTPLDTITVADLLNGVNGEDGKPYVVNGKLQYENGVKSVKNLFSGIADGEPTVHHSVEELTKQTLSAFPNAQNIKSHDNGVSFDLPNGSHVEVNFTDDTISVDRAKAQEDYGGTLTGNEKASGKIEMVGKDALITLTLDSPDETVSHEAMHLAWNLLTDKERNALLKTYGNEEGAAEGMREWKIRRKMRQGTIAGKIMQKISDIAHKLLSLFGENDQHVFQKLESGEIWERGNENNTAARNVKYKMNPLNEAEKYFKSHKGFGKKAGNYIDRTFRPDLANAKANPNISVNETKKKGWGAVDTALNNTVRSPSRIKSPKTSYIWGLADTAQRELQELRGKWTHSFAGAIKNLNSKEKERYTDILWEEDMKQHVFSDKELRDAGVSEKVIKAHQKTRSLLGRIYNAVNAVYTRERVENFTYKTRKEAEEAKKELAKRPHTFVMHDIREITKDGKPAFQVSIKTPGYKEIHSVMDGKEFAKLSKDKNAYVKSWKQLDDGSYKVSYLSYNKPLTNMEGYMPHIFHGVLIVKQYTDEDGNTRGRVVGSAESIDKAVVKADAMQKEDGGEYIIAPKEFSSEGEVENPLLLGDMDYFKLMENLRKGASLTLDEAREMTHATMKGRHVYYGAKKHRKGAEGFEKNAIWVIQHHIDSSSRYVTLDPFKQKAINFFERAFGDYNKDWTGEAAFCKGYIDSVLGKPSRLETLANDFLRLFPWFKNEARPARRMSGNLTGLTGVLKLGASVASGFVNTLQLFNCVGYVGARKTAVGLKRALHPNATDKKILVVSGVSEESGLALDSIGHIKAEGTALSKAGNVVNRVNDFLMKPFTFAEKTIRKATILAAYYKAIGDGLSKGEAIQYARNINRKVNFDYSVADAPRIFRALQGTVIGDMALQFQKYGVKEMEVISDFLPFIGDTTTKQKLEFFIPYLLVSGIWNAFPFEDALLSLLKLLGFDDPEKEAKRAMMEWAGNNPDRKALVNVANYGAGSLAGVDISQRVGLKGAVPETSNIMTGGPLGSTTVQLAKAVLNGDTNGAMKAISPAAGNIYGAVAGYNTDSKGRKTVDYDTRDRIARGLGFRTVKEANATDAQGIIYNYKEQKKDERAKAKAEYLKNPSSSNRQKLKEMGYSSKEIKALKDDKQSTRVERSQTGLSKEDKKKLKPVFDYVQ